MIQGIIFDLGGTLIWTNDDHFEAGNAWAAANYLRTLGNLQNAAQFAGDLVRLRADSPKGDEALRQINTTREHIAKVARQHGILLTPTDLDATERQFVQPESGGSAPLPGMLELLKSLQGRVRLGLLSNTRSHLLIEETLRQLGLETTFEPAMTSVRCGYRKPSPHTFSAVLTVWGVPPESVVMVGDSPAKDVAGAKAAGLRTIWLRTDSAATDALGADAIADQAEDILGILEGWGLPSAKQG